MTLTKAHIVNSISDQNGYPKSQSFEIVESLLELIKKTLESGDDVLISGFGKFCVKEKKERKGRNPSTGEDMILEPRKVLTFRSSGKLRKMVNGSVGGDNFNPIAGDLMGEIEVADHQLKSIEFEAEQGRVVTVEDSGVLHFQ